MESNEIIEDIKKEIVSELINESKIKNGKVDPEDYDKNLTESDNLKNKILESKYRSLEDDRAARKFYAACVFLGVGMYISVVLIIFCSYQFLLIPLIHHPISNYPIITLLSSTTANVIAALILVIKYIFPSPSE